MARKKKQEGKIYESHDKTFTVEVVAVPGGLLYITAHHVWHQFQVAFVKHDNVPEQVKSYIDYEKAFKFLTGDEGEEHEAN